eukprot:g13664.t1
MLDTGVPQMRVPLFYATVDASRAGSFQMQKRALLVGQMLPAGSAAAGAPILVGGADAAADFFGLGSMLHHMMQQYRLNDDLGEVYAYGLADDAGWTAASADLVVAGTATEAGTIALYIGGARYQIGVLSSDTAADVAADIAAAVNADALRFVEASAATGTVTFTARHKGLVMNGLKVEVAPRGPQGGERIPAGLTLTPADLAGGAGAPDVAAIFAALGDDEYDYVILPYTDAAALDAVFEAMNDVTGRWSYSRQVYGHVFAAKTGTLGDLATFGNALNDPHLSVLTLRASPTPDWLIASAFGATAAKELTVDPARPLQTLTLLGVQARDSAAHFTLSERNTLLFDGVSTAMVRRDGAVAIERAVTTYQLNAFDQPDNAWLDVNTPATLTEVIRRLRYVVTTQLARKKLVRDGTPIPEGSETTSPSKIRDLMIAEASEMVAAGLIEDIEGLKQRLIVETDAQDPNRVNVLFPPDLVNQLRIVAVKERSMKSIRGRITFLIGGQPKSIQGDGITIRYGGGAKTPVLDSAGSVVGYTEGDYRAPGFTVTRITTPGFDPAEVHGAGPQPITIEDADTGRSWTLIGGVLTNQIDQDTVAEVRFREATGADIQICGAGFVINDDGARLDGKGLQKMLRRLTGQPPALFQRMHAHDYMRCVALVQELVNPPAEVEDDGESGDEGGPAGNGESETGPNSADGSSA